MEMAIDALTPADWEQVRAIYLEGIATGQATFETEAPAWETWDVAHHPFARLVARTEGRLAGWAALSPVCGEHPPRYLLASSSFEADRRKQPN
jgi:L-amino acid N-acyltransferase YncA